MGVSRRGFLTGAGVGAASGVLAAGATAAAAASSTASPSGMPGDGADASPSPARSFPFEGQYQSGVLTPPPSSKQKHAAFVSFDVIASSSGELKSLLQTITARSRALTAGGAAPYAGVGAPPADSDILGPQIPPCGLTATVGLGSSLFDGRFGLGAKKPSKLTQMPVFTNDSPEDSWMHGDLLLQLCADEPDAIHHTLRDLTRHTRGGMQMKWRMDGYNSVPRPSGTSRNLLGFKDGTANPTGNNASSLVWVDAASEPAWARGGTYQVVRLIRMLVEFWDRVSIEEQEDMFGRRRDSGAPLTGNTEFDTPDYKSDPFGLVIPTSAHIRLANPRTPQTNNQQLIRRSYNYDLGIDANGNMQAGHVFCCFQQDVQRQFATIQQRLADEPLVDYVQPFGGGYFFVPPGVRTSTDYIGSGLFT
ncbi:Dyp-type peroxidase [Rudaeicoccus suwonensis]|uniref:Deferrochelatase/peroxidase EfeB n=1 Tax=Rudaeicoccus suwonensis TaxID=657409 RepID=A0A561E446_9MICO|nr:Dyp-type peroxidase [Rudaeicoccus suwonensis]TWE10385.1 deferrochelatase/peroxidase EfeB [Rudaeicoccus suwonensis]